MKRKAKVTISLVIMALGVLAITSCVKANDPPLALSRLLDAKEKVVSQISGMQMSQSDPLVKLIGGLIDLKQCADEFIRLPLESPASLKSLASLKKSIAKEPKYTAEDKLFGSFTLSRNNEKRARFLFGKLKDASSWSSKSIARYCEEVRSYKLQDPRNLTDLKSIRASSICKTVSSCSSKAVLYTNKLFQDGKNPFLNASLYRQTDRQKYANYKKKCSDDNRLCLDYLKSKPNFNHNDFRMCRKKCEKKVDEHRKIEIQDKLRQLYREQDVSSACTRNKKCNIVQALPMMIGILRFQINEMVFLKMCPKNCQNEKCEVEKIFLKAVEDIKRIIGITASLPSYWNRWKQFPKKVLNSKALSSLEDALSMVYDMRNQFISASYQCYFADFPKSCTMADVQIQVQLFEKLKKDRKDGLKVKSLQTYSNMDLSTMIQMLRSDSKHAVTLGNLKKIDNNNKASAKGISKYFQGVAKYDQEIAENDVVYIQGELEKYTKSLAQVEKKLVEDIKEGMSLMNSILEANIAEQVANLAATVATNSNPIKIIVSGPDVVDILEKSGELADRISQKVHGASLAKAVLNLRSDSINLIAAFEDNAKQITSLTGIVKKIINDKTDSIDDDADLFMSEYGRYSPKVDRSSLVKNDALWSAFKDSMCDVLHGDVGVAGAVFKAEAGGLLLCEKLEGTLAQFFTLREDIFDFQFQLVDQLALVIRGNIAKRLSKEITKQKRDILDVSLILNGFLMVQFKIQNALSVLCDRKEYQNMGKPIRFCQTPDGLFRGQMIPDLIAYKIIHREAERNVYIPGQIAKATLGSSILMLFQGESQLSSECRII